MKNNSILLIIIIIFFGLILYCNQKNEHYINNDTTCVEQKAHNSKYEKSQQLTKIGVVNQNNDNPLDYDICKKNIKNINNSACNIDINKDLNLSKEDYNKNGKCCKNKTCSCEKYLNNFGNETLFSDVLYITGNSCLNDTSAWEKCKKLYETNKGGSCLEFGTTGNFYYFPPTYADIKDYPTPTVFQKLSFRPG